MTDKQWDDKKIEDLLSSMPDIKDDRSATEVLARLKHDERLRSTQRKIFARRIPIPAFVAVAALLVLSLLLPSMLQSNDSIMTMDAESQPASIERENKLMQNSTEESEVAADNAADSGTFFEASMGAESHVVLQQELQDIRPFQIGLTHAAELIPVTFLIPEQRIRTDFPKGEPDSVTMYNKYATEIPETDLGFDEYHPYKGEITLEDDVVIHTIPAEHNYDMSSSTEGIYLGSIVETFTDHKKFKSVDTNGNPAEFSHTGRIETMQLDDEKIPKPYYKYTMPSGRFYLVPAGGSSEVTVIGALALMKEQSSHNFESVVPTSVTYDVHLEDEVAVITFKDLLDLTKLDTVQATAMIEGFMLTAMDYQMSVKLENVVQSNFGNYDLTSVLPKPVGANPLYLPEPSVD
jgi:hypothetical protein